MALWPEKGELKNCTDGSWGPLGALLARLGTILGLLPPPGGWPGRLREVFFEGFWEVKAETPEKGHFLTIFVLVTVGKIDYYV